MAEHTRGPWEFCPGDSGDASVGISPAPATITARVEDTDEEVEVARVVEPVYRVQIDPANEFDEGLRWVGSLEANGRLIAAAPELYRLLKLLAYHFPLDAISLRDPRHEVLRRAVDDASRVLDRVEGRETPHE